MHILRPTSCLHCTKKMPNENRLFFGYLLPCKDIRTLHYLALVSLLPRSSHDRGGGITDAKKLYRMSQKHLTVFEI